ncbi:unnamed protein product [marine sediment metagenome]|uniref:Uncharacterized protein n=1 Tax=marine sediment metagenome TaxID=412755 RepID=X1HZ84_9ZZZZ
MVAIFKMEVIKNLIPDKVDEIEVLKIEGKHFVFDKESLREYLEYFDDDYSKIFLEDGYLCRCPKWDFNMNPKKFQFFHRFLMEKELLQRGGKVHVHHLTWCKRINIKKYLLVIAKETHKDIHARSLYDRKYMDSYTLLLYL